MIIIVHQILKNDKHICSKQYTASICTINKQLKQDIFLLISIENRLISNSSKTFLRTFNHRKQTKEIKDGHKLDIEYLNCINGSN